MLEKTAPMRSGYELETAVVHVGIDQWYPDGDIRHRLELAVSVVLMQGDVAALFVLVGKFGDELLVGETEVGSDELLEHRQVGAGGTEAANRLGAMAKLDVHAQILILGSAVTHVEPKSLLLREQFCDRGRVEQRAQIQPTVFPIGCDL